MVLLVHVAEHHCVTEDLIQRFHACRADIVAEAEWVTCQGSIRLDLLAALAQDRLCLRLRAAVPGGLRTMVAQGRHDVSSLFIVEPWCRKRGASRGHTQGDGYSLGYCHSADCGLQAH